MKNQKLDFEQKFCYGIIQPMQPNIIGVRFTKIGKIYHFDSGPVKDIQIGEHVIVETARGKHLGEVIQVLDSPPVKSDHGWKPVSRRATPRDLLLLPLEEEGWPCRWRRRTAMPGRGALAARARGCRARARWNT